MHGRNPTTLDSDPIIVNSAIVDALRTYVETGLDEVACVAAKFLDAFMHHAQLVEAFEVDNFIFRNGSSLCTWYVGCYPRGASSSSPQCVSIWQFYAIQAPEISRLRTTLLLRVLVVDAQPFQALLQDLFEFSSAWEAR